MKDPNVVLEEFVALLDKVQRSGDNYTALCPAHDDKERSLSFKLGRGKLLAHCFAGCSFEDIMSSVGMGKTCTVRTYKPTDYGRYAKNRKATDELWSTSVVASSNLTAQKYLASRGLDVDILKDLLSSDIRIAFAQYWDSTGDEPTLVGEFPALVCRVLDSRWEWKTLHRTYLKPDGSGKAELNPARKMMGARWPTNDKSTMIRISEPSSADAPVAFCEGLETGMAWLCANPGHRVISCVSANGLTNAHLHANLGSEVWVVGDNDKSGTGQKAAKELAQRMALTRTTKICIPDLVGTDFLDSWNNRKKT